MNFIDLLMAAVLYKASIGSLIHCDSQEHAIG